VGKFDDGCVLGPSVGGAIDCCEAIMGDSRSRDLVVVGTTVGVHVPVVGMLVLGNCDDTVVGIGELILAGLFVAVVGEFVGNDSVDNTTTYGRMLLLYVVP